jgi:hypothetical protein
MPQTAYDPRGPVEYKVRPLAARVARLDGLRLAVLDNTKWNGRKLLEYTVESLRPLAALGTVTLYRKHTYTRFADPALLAAMAAGNDIALTAIGD